MVFSFIRDDIAIASSSLTVTLLHTSRPTRVAMLFITGMPLELRKSWKVALKLLTLFAMIVALGLFAMLKVEGGFCDMHTAACGFGSTRASTVRKRRKMK